MFCKVYPMRKKGSPIQVIGSLLLISYVGWEIYKRCRPKQKGYTDYVKRGADYETYFRYKKAFETYEEARSLPDLTTVQRANLDLSSGTCLLKRKDYKGAIPYFERAFEQKVGHIHYGRRLKLILKGYMLAGEHEKARQLYEKLINRSGTRDQFHKWKKQTSLFDSDVESK